MSGKTSASMNANGPFLVRASDGSEQRFVDYNAARRWARRVAGTVQQVTV